MRTIEDLDVAGKRVFVRADLNVPLDGDRITDDGRGLADTAGRGSGLTNMADRAAALGGRVTIDAGPSGGTTVVCDLPVAPTVAV